MNPDPDFSTEEQFALLHRFEPIMRFTQGEEFFPMDVEPYVRSSSLWAQNLGEAAICIVPQGELTLESIADQKAVGFRSVYYLRFIEPLDLRQLIQFLRRKKIKKSPQGAFKFGFGRLARVGYGSRFADLIFSLSLLLRGRVPGDTSAAAILEYNRIMNEKEQFAYHGRVLRQGGWVILQYWFFYAFNNWRSGFFGVNDHEGDWEVVNVYLYEKEGGTCQPEWVAYSSHDMSGDDLRRRWDDPEIEKIDEHPVVYPGAGSHSCYFSSGEYLAEIELPFMRLFARGINRISRAWRRFFGISLNVNADMRQKHNIDILRVPFVDYARGDGLVIGYGGEKQWGQPRLLSPIPEWISQYPGLWGLYAQDPIAGEDAPAGPMYNRDGSIRTAWCDPLGWAGLDKVPVPNEIIQSIHQQKTELLERIGENRKKIKVKSQELVNIGILRSAIRDHAEFRTMDILRERDLANVSSELSSIRARLAEDEKLIRALNSYEKRVQRGELEPSRIHLRRPLEPASEKEMRANRLVELWAAISIGLILIGFVALVFFYRQHVILGLIVMLSVFVFIESGFRKRLDLLIRSIAMSLSIVTILILIFNFFWHIVVSAVLFAGIFILWENMKEFFIRR